MPKRRKEPTLYAVKRPDGTLITTIVDDTREKAWNMAVDSDPEMSMVDKEHGYVVEDSDRVLRKLGYRVVKVKVVEAE